MGGREFLTVAREAVQGTSEAHWRTAAGRAYYAAMLEALNMLDRWGIQPRPRENVHSFVRLRLTYARDQVLTRIGITLEELGRLRNHADYHLATLGAFATPRRALDAIGKATTVIATLDQIDQDPQQRAAAIAAL